MKAVSAKRQPPRIIYIAGYGRSGSTLLERVLALHSDVRGLGELASMPQGWESGCSCGAVLRDCAFWRPIWDRIKKETGIGPDSYPALARRFEGVWPWAGLRGRVGWWGRWFEAYCHATRMLYVLASRSGNEAAARFVVDSSKTAYASCARPRLLNRLFGQDLFVVHIVRDIRAVAGAIAKKGIYDLRSAEPVPKRAPMAAWRALVGWVVANACADKVREALPTDRQIIVRYEDLVANPHDVLEAIGRRLGLEYGEIAEQLKVRGVVKGMHLVGGNPGWIRTPLVKIRIPTAERWEPPWLWRVVAAALAGASKRRYGYG